MNDQPASWCMYYRGITPPPRELLDINIISEKYRKRPFFAYPMAFGQLQQFDDLQQWYEYVERLRLQPGRVRLPFVDAFDEALRALFMAYIFPEFCKLAEMKAFTTLESALLDAYEHKMCTINSTSHKCARLAGALSWANKNDGMPSEWYRQTMESKSRCDLPVIRNKQMHGALLEETLPWGGLFETIKKILEYAYRNTPPYDVHQQCLAYESGQFEMSRNDLDYVPVHLGI